MAQNYRSGGLNPLAYMGTESRTPPQLVVESRIPTARDKKNFNVGTLWVTYPGQSVWILMDLISGNATWVQIYPNTSDPGASAASLFHTDGADATPVNNTLNVLGNTITTTSGSGNTVVLSLTGGLDGQVLIGSTGVVPVWGNLTSTGGTIIITEGSNTINLETVSAGALSFITDSGTAVPAATNLNVLGGANLNTAGAGSTITVNLDANVTIPGTVTVTPLGRGVVQSDASGVFSADEGTDGQMLISSSSGAPAWANITSTDGSVDITNGANSIDLSYTGSSDLGSRYAFLAHQASNQATLGDATTYTLGDASVLTEVFDAQSVFYPGDGAGASATFTASVTGKYILTSWFRFDKIIETTGSSITTITVEVITSNRTFEAQPQDRIFRSATGSVNTFYGFSQVVDFDSSDTATWRVTFDMGLSSGDAALFGDASLLSTFVSGCLVA